MLSNLLAPTLFAGLCAIASAQVTVGVSGTVPEGASATVSPSFVAWAFEERSFYYFFGPGGSPIELTNNLINSVASRTGTVPFIRVGGSSLNAASYDSSQSDALVIPTQNQAATIPVGMTIGPSYFGSFKNINANYQLDIPMSKKSDVANSVQFAQAAWKTIGSDHIAVLELGNEPNSYGGGYAPSDYADQFQQFSTAISQGLGISTSDRRWQVGSLTNGVTEKWNATVMFSAGLQSQIQKIVAFSAHYYQFSTLGALSAENNLMSHDNIVSKMEKWQGTVDYLASLSPSIPLNFAEVGSGIGHPAGGTNVMERSFGSALWQVDFMLYAMTIGINRVNMQSGLGFQFSQFEPVAWNGADAAVFANHYASLFVADFISTSNAMQCAEIDLNSDLLTAYAAYDNGKLARVALVNFNFYNGSESSAGSRDSTTFSVQVPDGQTSVTVMRLSSNLGAGAMDASDITWGGQSWTVDSNGNAVAGATNDTATINVKNGYASIDVPASEAVMVLFSGSASSSSTTSASSSFITSTTTFTHPSETPVSLTSYTFPTPIVPLPIHSSTTTTTIVVSTAQTSATSSSSTVTSTTTTITQTDTTSGSSSSTITATASASVTSAATTTTATGTASSTSTVTGASVTPTGAAAATPLQNLKENLLPLLVGGALAALFL